jgi:signal transduction histidine kinase
VIHQRPCRAEKVSGGQLSGEDERAVEILAEFAGVAIDHARHYQGLEARSAELERTVDALNATVQVAQTVGGDANIDAILELVATRGQALMSARALVIEQQRDGEMVIVAGAGELPHGLIGQRINRRESVAGAALRGAATLRLEDQANMTRFARDGLGRLGVHADAGLVVPLVFRGRSHGVLVAIDRLRGGPAFTPDDQRLLETFAASVATALASARAAASERRSQRLAAAERERERWARELHDQTLQALAALRIALGSQLRARDPQRMGQVIADAVRQLDREIAGLRSLITELRPATLDDLGIKAAIETLVDRARVGGLEVHARIHLSPESHQADRRHDSGLETAVYRITQEALTNALKHGDAQRALVDVRELDRTVQVTVRDNGRGFDPQPKPTDSGCSACASVPNCSTERSRSTPPRGWAQPSRQPSRRSAQHNPTPLPAPAPGTRAPPFSRIRESRLPTPAQAPNRDFAPARTFRHTDVANVAHATDGATRTALRVLARPADTPMRALVDKRSVAVPRWRGVGLGLQKPGLAADKN